jgi:hypothetical protein
VLAVRFALARFKKDGKVNEPTGTINAPTRAAVRPRMMSLRLTKGAFSFSNNLSVSM